MTLRLLLMRHAKSAFALEQFSDHERSLAPKGRQSVPKVASKIVELKLEPDLIYCSDSVRTKETLDLFIPALTVTPRTEITKALYEASPQEIIQFIEDRNPEITTLQVIGHNPTLEALLEHLSNEFRNFEPGNIAVLTHTAVSWDRALNQKGTWILTNFISAI